MSVLSVWIEGTPAPRLVSRPPDLPTRMVGVPASWSAWACRSNSLAWSATLGELAVSCSCLTFPPGRLAAPSAATGARGRDQRVVEPAAVLGPLVEVEELREVEAAVLREGGDHRAPAPLRVRADHRDRPGDHLQLAGAHVAVDQGRHQGGRVVAADRALQVDVLDERRRRRRLAEHVPLLRNARELLLDRRRVRERRAGGGARGRA